MAKKKASPRKVSAEIKTLPELCIRIGEQWCVSIFGTDSNKFQLEFASNEVSLEELKEIRDYIHLYVDSL